MNNFGIDMTGEVADVEPVKTPVDLDPIEYVQHIRKINPGNDGRPIDIRNARQMTKADLLVADPRGIELLLIYGVSQNQIAKIYDTPMGSLTRILRDMGVDTSVKLLVKEKFDTRKTPAESHPWKKFRKTTALPEPDVTPETNTEVHEAVSEAMTEPEVTAPARDIITDPAKIAELMSEPVLEDIAAPQMPGNITINTIDAKGFKKFIKTDGKKTITTYSYPEPQTYTWFNSTPKPGTTTMLTVMESGKISLPMAIRKQFDRIRVGFAGPGDNLNINVLAVSGTDDPGIGAKTSLKQAKISYGVIADQLVLYGKKLPAKYKMSWSESEQLWVGELMP